MKPKLWDGPNAIGEARARALEGIDTPYLTASGPGFTARKKGQFSEVTGEVIEPTPVEQVIFSQGYVVSGGAGRTAIRGATSTTAAFSAAPKRGEQDLGRGYSATLTYKCVWVNRTAHLWSPGLNAYMDILWPAREYEYTITIYKFGKIYQQTFTAAYQFAHNNDGWVPLRLLPVGYLSPQEPCVFVVATPQIGTSSTVELLPDAYIRVQRFVVGHGAVTVEDINVSLPSTSPYAAHHVGKGFVITPSSFGFITFRGVQTSNTDDGANYEFDAGTPTVFSAASTNLARDQRQQGFITKTTDGGHTWVSTVISPLDVEHDFYSGDYWWGWSTTNTPTQFRSSVLLWGQPRLITVNDNGGWGGYWKYTMHQLTVAAARSDILVLSPTVMVMIVPLTVWIPVVGTVGGGVDPAPLMLGRTVMMRSTDAGATWTRMYLEPFARAMDYFNQSDASVGLYATATPLREGVGIFRLVYNRENSDVPAGTTMTNLQIMQALEAADDAAPVVYLLTEDYGVTWTTCGMAGLPVGGTLAKNLGALEVLKVELEGTPSAKSTVGVTVLSGGEYWVYSSDDDCATWKKRHRVARSDSPVRVGEDFFWAEIYTPDGTTLSSVAADGYTARRYGAFNLLNYSGPHAKPPPFDIAMPWRCDARIAPPP